jgi:hypothetical protein
MVGKATCHIPLSCNEMVIQGREGAGNVIMCHVGFEADMTKTLQFHHPFYPG